LLWWRRLQTKMLRQPGGARKRNFSTSCTNLDKN
jgi:hypothetical protein